MEEREDDIWWQEMLAWIYETGFEEVRNASRIKWKEQIEDYKRKYEEMLSRFRKGRMR